MDDHRIRVYYLPHHVAEQELAGSTVVVIDLLRATTTICQALASGALEVVPFLEVEDALAAAAKFDRDEIVLGGERRGAKILGFDLGNSPAEYTPEALRGRRVLLTTTNGTRALHHARLARRIVIASFLNLSAVVASIKDEPQIDILCAGTDGAVTGEDVLAAGALVARLAEQSTQPRATNVEANVARRDWDVTVRAANAAGISFSELIALALKDTPGGRNLLEIGMGQDLVDCAQLDRLHIVPELNEREWRITVPRDEKQPR